MSYIFIFDANFIPSHRFIQIAMVFFLIFSRISLFFVDFRTFFLISHIFPMFLIIRLLYYFPVVLADVNFDVLTLIIQYVYCGKTTVVDNLFNDFMATARKFELVGFHDDDFAINITKTRNGMSFSHASSSTSARHPAKCTQMGKEMSSPKVSSTNTDPKPQKRKRSPVKTNSEYHSSDADAEDDDNNNNQQKKAKKSSK